MSVHISIFVYAKNCHGHDDCTDCNALMLKINSIKHKTCFDNLYIIIYAKHVLERLG